MELRFAEKEHSFQKKQQCRESIHVVQCYGADKQVVIEHSDSLGCDCRLLLMLMQPPEMESMI